MNPTVVESVWEKMENVHKQSQVTAKTPKKDTVQNQEQDKGECFSLQANLFKFIEIERTYIM